MFRKTLLYRVMAALLTLALLLPAFTVAAVPAEPEDEPVYDMIGWRRFWGVNMTDDGSYKCFKFNSEDPTIWTFIDGMEFFFPEGNTGLTPASVIRVGDYYYTTAYMNDYLNKYDNEFNLVSQTLLTESKYGNVCVAFDLNYSEFDGQYYVNYGYGSAEEWGIASIDLDTGVLDPLFAWHYEDGTLFNFWPVAFAPMPDGNFIVLDAWSNCLYSMNVENYESPVFVAYLPELASTFPYGTVDQFMPQDMHYDAETNTAYWCSGNAIDVTNKLLKIDVATGEILYNVDTQAEGMPNDSAFGYCGGYPIIGIEKYSEPEAIALGDVDGSGEVNTTDALLVLRYAMGIITELEHIDKADADGSGDITVTDALVILRMAMGIV